jgi:hypothetical protein
MLILTGISQFAFAVIIKVIRQSLVQHNRLRSRSLDRAEGADEAVAFLIVTSCNVNILFRLCTLFGARRHQRHDRNNEQ